MIPDRATVAAFLRKVEQGVHRNGWDQPAVFAELHWRPARGVLRLAPMPLPDGNPGEFLAFSANLLSAGDPYSRGADRRGSHLRILRPDADCRGMGQRRFDPRDGPGAHDPARRYRRQLRGAGTLRSRHPRQLLRAAPATRREADRVAT